VRLGERGGALNRMGRLGVPVPEGFVISPPEVINDEEVYGELEEQVRKALRRVEEDVGRSLHDPETPLLLAARVESPGEVGRSVFNLGLDGGVAEALIRRPGDRREVHETYRSFLVSFGEAAYRVDGSAFRQTGVSDVGNLERALGGTKEALRDATSQEVPEDTLGQLLALVRAVRDLGDGVGFVTVTRVISSSGEGSATGVVRTHDRKTGAKNLDGEFVTGTGGKDREPYPLGEMEELLPEAHEGLLQAMGTLEKDYRDAVETEFAVENGRLYMLESRVGDSAGDAAARIKVTIELLREGVISCEEALLRVDATGLSELLHPRVDPEARSGAEVLARGLAASPGAASGGIVLSAGEAREKKEAGEPAVLVTVSVGPDDKEGILAAAAVVTPPGGIESHDLVVLRGMGTPVVSGCEDLEVDVNNGEVRFGEKKIEAGDLVTVDGSGGEVLLGKVPVLSPATGGALEELLSWADETRTLSVRANADSPEDAGKARRFGAEGIGLCRTERMFIKGGRLEAVRRMILAEEGSREEAEALSELEQAQREDFEGIFRAMSGLPVAVRLLDPPLHEFLPAAQDLRERLSDAGNDEETAELRHTLETVEALEETNPMLGTRGVRLGILRPAIYRMQARAVVAATRKLREEGHEPMPEILVPQVQFPEELQKIKEILHGELEGEEILVGITVETPRACAVAGSLANVAPFFSFGTNDLTQTTMGISRDDAKGGFLPEYLKEGLLEADPFERIDEDGVGRLIHIARDLGREANPDLVLGVCGEHGGEPESIRFFQEAGLDYISCSPYRVPVARLAAAQAAINAQ